MTDQIRQALAALDPNRDEDWTSSGLPAMDAVKALVGEDITRAQVAAAAPDFTRSSRSIPAATSMSAAIAADLAAGTFVGAAPTIAPSPVVELTPAQAAHAERQDAHARLAEHERIVRALAVERIALVAACDAADAKCEQLCPKETDFEARQRFNERGREETLARLAATAAPAPDPRSPIDRQLGSRRRAVPLLRAR